jgi:hypothetical protein
MFGELPFTPLGSRKVIQALITNDGIFDAEAKRFERYGVEIVKANRLRL